MTLPPPTKLETERLILRPLSVEDSNDLHVCFTDAQTRRYGLSPPHETLEQTRAYLAENAAAELYKSWAITDRAGETAGRAFGWVTLVDLRPGVAELGYTLRRNRWGQGYAKEAVGAVVRHGMADLGLRRIFGDVDPDNPVSIGVLLALGFEYEGRLRANYETHIGVRDSLIYALVAPS